MNETIVGIDADVQRTLELVGLFVFAISGALLAVRKHFDVVGGAALGVFLMRVGALRFEWHAPRPRS